MNLELILAAGVASGTVLLFAAIGEIFTERSGIINLGVEGMMFVGALAGFKVGSETGDPWLGLVAGHGRGRAAGAPARASSPSTSRPNQIVSGLALTFLGTGVALVLGEGLAAGSRALLPVITLPLLSADPLHRAASSSPTSRSSSTWATCWCPSRRCWIFQHAAGPAPARRGRAAQRRGCPGRQRLPPALRLHDRSAARWPGLAGATITHGRRARLARRPRPSSAQGWIAVALVIFAQWKPGRTMFGAYLIAFIRRLTLDLQGTDDFFGIPNPFFTYQPSTFFLDMLPYAMVILVLVFAAREANRKRIGAPAALGCPISGANAATDARRGCRRMAAAGRPADAALRRTGA